MSVEKTSSTFILNVSQTNTYPVKTEYRVRHRKRNTERKEKRMRKRQEMGIYVENHNIITALYDYTIHKDQYKAAG